MDLFNIFIRTIMVYFVVLFVMRLMGKREVGKLSILDLIISIMIAETAVFVLEDIHRPFFEGLIPLLTLVLIQIIIAYISLKSRKVRLWFDGKPSFLIANGQLDREEMKKQRYNLDDLMLQLRQKDVNSVADVEFAILETTGKLTVIEKDENKINSSKIRYEGLPIVLIMDGKVMDENLVKIGKTRFWLKDKIKEHGAADFKKVFFCTVDHRGKIYVDIKR